ncbi:hypothetical protein C5748_25890 [Phyllobacterium phragmitis]|uniref:HTH cro/C1-type domain-containing protein n=1 Tax=Phyllobacterium phragmitis TaxID=2670329 RepID=A0A2S9IJE1_9HYPH|nr:hypothetical protein C5748_25890 [Phyllobacterium phragmitis]
MTSGHRLTAEQCQGARAMLGWSQANFEKAANVSRQTIADFEPGAHLPISNNLTSVKRHTIPCRNTP